MSSQSQIPITRLPVEILSLIFIECPHIDSTFKAQTTPWTLGRVCRAWRAVALGTPELWRIIHLNLQELSNKGAYSQVYASILSAALERSAEGPLDIHITPRCNSIESLVDYRPLFEMVLDHCERWHSFILSAGRSRWVKREVGSHVVLHEVWTSHIDATRLDLSILRLNKDRKLSFPLLEEVKLDEAEKCRNTQRFFRRLRSAPLLTRATLSQSGDFSLTAGVFPQLKWGRITHLELTGCSVHEIMPLLGSASFSRLETLLLQLGLFYCWPNDVFPRHLNALPMMAVVLPKLRRLRIPLKDPYLSVVCANLKLPILRELELVMGGCQSDMNAVIRMIDGSGSPNIKTIVLAHVSMMEYTIKRLLHHPAVANATRLELLEGFYAGYLFDSIASGELLPKLKDLRIGCINGPLSLPLNAMKRLIETRARKGSGIRSLSITMAHRKSRVQWAEESRTLVAPDCMLSVDFVHCEGGEANVVVGVIGIIHLLFRQDTMLDKSIIATNLEENMPTLDFLFTMLESYDGFTAKNMKKHKLHETVRLCADAPVMPREAEFHIKERAKNLYERWERASLLPRRRVMPPRHS
ncbi:hypothetical protein Moror_2215 [Moniliophthora roreri MCA 2997]|uniref:F-box domain-containing protein n=2 Tax=Moniliophthora roreri TaxID=221103 RepID=V2XSD1_MONRO|nr:hypothetical protein Moror_2215 [Moniliophthora roreri MCA 2997]